MVEFIDPLIADQIVQKSVLRCIQIALLCVQELAKDRPSISNVISMLDSDTELLPQPKKPPFSEWEASSENPQSSSIYSSSTNTFSTTLIQGR